MAYEAALDAPHDQQPIPFHLPSQRSLLVSVAAREGQTGHCMSVYRVGDA